MIDIENAIITKLSNALTSSFSGINIVTDETTTPSTFPTVSILEVDNYTYRAGQDSSGNENYALVMYEVCVYSNKRTGKKSECKSILAVADELMMGIGFTRTMSNPIVMGDATIYRMIARYEALVSKEKIIHRG